MDPTNLIADFKESYMREGQEDDVQTFSFRKPTHLDGKIERKTKFLSVKTLGVIFLPIFYFPNF